jgi:outer membrane protein assembly factor BamB
MRRLAPWIALLVLAACSKDKEIDPPAELMEFPTTMRVQRAWDASMSGEAEALRLGLGLTINAGTVYGAGRGGDVAAFDLDTGKQRWRTRTKVALAGGTGADDATVAVGSSDGWVVALNAADGVERWRTQVKGEVIAAPGVSERAIIVRTVDGKLRGLAAADGKQLWEYEQPIPRLTLRGTSKPVISGDMAICGFDNGKVVAVSLSDGSLVWEATVAPPRGRTELERLVDIDSAVKISDDDVYAVGFQGRVAMLARETGQVWWSHEASSYRGLAIDDANIYLSNADGEVVALSRRSGAELWRQNGLLHRGLSAPIATADAVVVADFQGFVHFLDKTTGAFAGRASAGGARVSNAPLEGDGMVLVINDVGHIAAFRGTPLLAAASKSAPAAPRPAPETPPGAATSESSDPAPAAESAPSGDAVPQPAPAEEPPAPTGADAPAPAGAPASSGDASTVPTGEAVPAANPDPAEPAVPVEPATPAEGAPPRQ